MKKQIKSIEGLEGATISSVIISGVNGRMIITTDKGFAFFESELWPSGFLCLDISEKAPCEQEMRDAGVITDEEYQSIIKAKERRLEINLRAKEIKELERLKKKYEGAED